MVLVPRSGIAGGFVRRARLHRGAARCRAPRVLSLGKIAASPPPLSTPRSVARMARVVVVMGALVVRTSAGKACREPASRRIDINQRTAQEGQQGHGPIGNR